MQIFLKSSLTLVILISLSPLSISAAIASKSHFVSPSHVATCDKIIVLKQIKAKSERDNAKNNLPKIISLNRKTIHQTHAHAYSTTDMISRRWCQVKAHFSDHKMRTIYYLIEEQQGFASLRDRVSSCSLGLDPWHIYGRSCKTLKPY